MEQIGTYFKKFRSEKEKHLGERLVLNLNRSLLWDSAKLYFRHDHKKTEIKIMSGLTENCLATIPIRFK